MANNTALKVAIGFVVVVVALSGGYLYLRSRTPAQTANPLYSGPIGPYAELMSSNEPYMRAQRLMASRNYSDALKEFTAALAIAKDSVHAAQIRFNIAHATAAAGDPATAINMYKEIAKDEANLPILRAYAIEYMGRLYYATRSKTLAESIFTGDVFGAMLVPNSDVLSYRNLFEYGSSIFPLALTELYIASGYASDLAALPETASEESRAQILAVIHAKLASADREVVRMTQSTSNEIALLPETLFQKASVLDKLLSLDDTITTSAVESAYTQALNAYTTTGDNGDDFYVRLYFAAFLANAYSTDRVSDVIAVLVPVYTSMRDTNSPRIQYLLNNRNSAAAHHAKLELLAETVPQFKQSLISLGWHEEDFQSE